MIKFRCPKCKKKIGVKDDLAGRPAKCPACQMKFRIPLIERDEFEMVEPVQDEQDKPLDLLSLLDAPPGPTAPEPVMAPPSAFAPPAKAKSRWKRKAKAKAAAPKQHAPPMQGAARRS